ncbi:lipid A deacylase LpxR family protein [Loktanella sp. TSTF-M6]|uniref:Lipid A deacylase LpxR family protein n=1 Tax=Loktanella gaetbuli TaxID=2881335 RepID=A0ABS8BYK5_9RHOB|nr:lipid A-modifier LpxR family protein [Loktanella gaetbuli]MCB5200795.1 lipid A deacylase LpxR family protein [Loktanella gaetbuli]
MNYTLHALILSALTCATPALSQDLLQDRQGIGNGRLFTNDVIGDGSDRWRTGSYVYSHLRAPRPHDGALQPFGDVLEYRLRAEIIAPDSGTRGRPYVGLLSAGAHTHFDLSGTDASVGADVVLVGPQTGMDDFQEFYHDTFGLQVPLNDPQLDDDVFLDVTGELRRTYQLGDQATIRPFVEAKLGTEDIARIGADLIVGRVGQDDLLVRDVVTGQLYPGAMGTGSGVGFVLGGDIASVAGSNFLPEDEGYHASDTRSRARAGVNWQPHPGLSLFYGATYLSREFDEQPEGQVVGSVRLNFSF